MILTCPECQKQFNVPFDKIGEEGRMVRCGACKNTWRVRGAEEDNDETLENTDIDATLDEFREVEGELKVQEEVEPSFKSALSKEMGTDAPNPKKTAKVKKLKQEKKAVLSALIGIICVLVVLLGSLPFKSKIIEAWSASEGLYRLVGLSIPVEGQSLVFDRVQIRSNADDIEVTGFIINLAKITEIVPRVQLSIPKGRGEATEINVFSLPFAEIEGEASRPFRKSMKLPDSMPEGLDGAVENLRLQFVQ